MRLSLHRYQPDQVQRVAGRYTSLSVTRLPGVEEDLRRLNDMRPASGEAGGNFRVGRVEQGDAAFGEARIGRGPMGHPGRIADF